MPLPVYTIIAAIAIFGILMSLANDLKIMAIICSVVLGVVCSVMLLGLICNWEIETTTIVECSTVNDVQIIIYPSSKDGTELNILNVNSRFGKKFQDGDKFLVEYRKAGPYFGVTYLDNLVNVKPFKDE